ncbi:MAG: selenide, water dikinase SelD, partial [Bacteroidia bacterium]|nr:selenide, water dikinase SelD [Bacteroidia bacterium]
LDLPSEVAPISRREDAAVWNLNNGTYLLSTTDFFTPMLDDPKTFGQIAVCNALSDVYAMGGTPLFALGILGWNIEQLGIETVKQVLEGAISKLQEVNVPLTGGHSIENKEPFFGLAVTGTVAVEHLKQNSTAQAGDSLFLTKPLGTGILMTALKAEKISIYDPIIQNCIQNMTQLNSIGSKFGQLPYVTAMTDVTGFGLFGHLLEMIGSNLDAELQSNVIPVFPGLQSYIEAYLYPAGLMRNWKSYGEQVQFSNLFDFYIGCDPQTNGGLLVSVSAEFENDFVSFCMLEKQTIRKIGKIKQGTGKIFIN